MTRPPSAEELERLARIWFSGARHLSAQDQAEVEAWKKEHRKWTHVPGGGFSGEICSPDSGDCGGDRRAPTYCIDTPPSIRTGR